MAEEKDLFEKVEEFDEELKAEIGEDADNAFLEEDKVDPDIEPISEIAGSSGGAIDAESYDIKPELDVFTEQQEELSSKESIDIEYNFTGAEVAEGLKIFQKETIYKRNIIYTLILGVIFVLYIIGITKDPSNGFSVFLAVMCIAVIAFIWYMPMSHIRKTVKATDENQMSFKMSVFDSCIRIGEENGTFIMHYGSEITKIYETIGLFLICAGKERMFVLPKRCIPEGRVGDVKEIFSLAMQDKYIKKL